MLPTIDSSHFLLRLVAACLGCLVYSAPAIAQAYDGSLIDAVRLTLEGGSSIAISKTTIRSDVTSDQAGLTQKLRSGATVNPALTETRTNDNDLNVTAPSSANVTLNFTLPMLTGGGENVVTAFERSAMLNREAAVHGRRHAISSAVTVTVLAYRDLLAARHALDIAGGAEERASGVLASVKLADLVAASIAAAPGLRSELMALDSRDQSDETQANAYLRLATLPKLPAPRQATQ